MTRHLITGVGGQDGTLLARRLLQRGDEVVGTHRPGSVSANLPYLTGVELIEHDLRDLDGFRTLVRDYQPDTVFNLAAMSSVAASWEDPETAWATNAQAPIEMLEVLRESPSVRFVQASSAEQFGDAAQSPYARAKAASHAASLAARSAGTFACTASLHIHESPLRPRRFVVRKVTDAVARIALGHSVRLSLGTVEIQRDWVSAYDTVAALDLLSRQPEPTDWEIATGRMHSLRDVVATAFSAAGIEGDPWSYVDLDPTIVRPADSAVLRGDPTRAIAAGWLPQVSFAEMIGEMVRVDLARVSSGVDEDPSYLAAGGFVQ